MALAAGTGLGPYEITAQLGIGGPASARAMIPGELRQGLAVAKGART